MSLFGHNSFGSFVAYHSEEDWVSGHDTLTEATLIAEKALGEQFALWTDMAEEEQTDSRLAVYKQGGEGNWVWDLVTVQGDDNTLIKYHEEFKDVPADTTAGTDAIEGEAAATEAFNAKLTCADPNATYNADTDACECNTGYTANTDTGACEPDEEETDWMPYAIGGGALLIAGFFMYSAIKS